jgi:hypothetical protein
MPRKLAATLENNAWRSREYVVADYVPECMHHHSDDKAVVRHRPRRLRSARLAQEAEGAGGRLIKNVLSFSKERPKIFSGGLSLATFRCLLIYAS